MKPDKIYKTRDLDIRKEVKLNSLFGSLSFESGQKQCWPTFTCAVFLWSDFGLWPSDLKSKQRTVALMNWGGRDWSEIGATNTIRIGAAGHQKNKGLGQKSAC